MASSNTVKQLARLIEEKHSQPSTSQPCASQAYSVRASVYSQVSARLALQQDYDNSVRASSSVEQLARHIQDHGSAGRDKKMREDVAIAVQSAVSDMTVAGHEVTTKMIQQACEQASLANDSSMRDRAYRVLLREAAVRSALKEAEDHGVEIRNWRGDTWAKEGEARLAASSNGPVDYETMVTNALRALSSDKQVYVVMVTGYKRAGLDLSVSMSTLGGQSFEIIVGREVSVAEAIFRVQQDRLQLTGKTVEVKLVGPGGTVLPLGKLISDALYYESDVVELDDEHGQFYPLSVLAGTQGSWRQLGLDGKTRWEYLRECDFRQLFGMGKATFKQLPEWKQTPLKKKHNLF